MADAVQTKQGKGKCKWMCGTPEGYCSGPKKGVSGFNKSGVKLHGSPREARNCYKRYLMSEAGGGYILGDDAGSMVDPKHEKPCITLTKTSRFGTKLRPGKAGRNMPTRHTSGVIVSK